MASSIAIGKRHERQVITILGDELHALNEEAAEPVDYTINPFSYDVEFKGHRILDQTREKGLGDIEWNLDDYPTVEEVKYRSTGYGPPSGAWKQVRTATRNVINARSEEGLPYQRMWPALIYKNGRNPYRVKIELSMIAQAHYEYSKPYSLGGTAEVSISDYALLVHALFYDRYFERKRREFKAKQEGAVPSWANSGPLKKEHSN